MAKHYLGNFLITNQMIVAASLKEAKSLYDYNKRNNNNIHLSMISDGLLAVWPK